jgi:O-antigen/teichoic acid export membrane protein
VGLSISTLKKNLAASFVGNGWTALMAVVLVPLYIKFLGLEAWGLIGIFASLQAICALLDLGLSATLTREMARLSVREEKGQEMRDLTRTLELIYWGIAAVIGISVFALAPLIAHHWVQANQLPRTTIQHAIRVIGLAICLQWPFGLYSGGLLGLQRQVLLSCINVGIATLRGVGAILILWTVSSTLQAFFLWQVAVNLLQTCLAGLFLWRSLPKTETDAHFQSKLLRDTWRFAAGISGITVMSVILTQMDKVILSRLLSLEMFGYYILAGAVATSIYLLVLPVFSALYPRFTQLVSLGDEEGLRELYHHSCQLMSVLILPVSIVMAFFSKEILFLWTGDLKIVEHTHLILSILAAGTALNSLMHLPYALQLAHGWTKLSLYTTIVAVLLLTPLIIQMTSLYGAVGAASVWVIFNGALVVIVIQLMHRRLQKGEQWRWYFEDVGLPLAVSIGAALLCLTFVPTGGLRLQLLMVLAGVTVFTTGSTFLATPVTRLALIRYWKSWRGQPLDVS